MCLGVVLGWGGVEETSFIGNITQAHNLIFKCNGHLPTVLQDPFYGIQFLISSQISSLINFVLTLLITGG